MNKEFTQSNLEAEMSRITKEERKIPQILYVEMALMSTVGIILRMVMQSTTENGIELFSQVYPNLIIRVWNQPGWELE